MEKTLGNGMDGTVWVGWMEHTWIEYYVHKTVHCGRMGSLAAHKEGRFVDSPAAVRHWGVVFRLSFTLQRRRRLLLLSSFYILLTCLVCGLFDSFFSRLRLRMIPYSFIAPAKLL
jgi:hypothetical protein